MADVFVSYARADKARVAPLVAAIEAKGWSVWWDPEISPGQEFDDQIDAEIDAAKAVLVVWTPTSVVSRWVRGEAREAAERGILVPVRFEQARLPMDVRAIHTTDLDNWREDPASPLMQECLHALAAMISRATAAQAAKAGSTAAASPAPDNSKRFSVCVLPFTNMSGDSEQEYFSDGITEDIITDLSKVSALAVASSNSAFQYKGKHADIQKVVHELKVTHVLEGSVRKAGERIRINAQLIDGATNNHVWAERYDRDANDIFAIQDEISQAIVKALKLRLLPEEKKAIERRGTDSAEAHDLYLMARQIYVTNQEADERASKAIVRLCAGATELDPKYAQAWALTAIGYRTLRVLGAESDDGMEAAERALALNPDLAEAHAVKASILLMRNDIDAAAAEVAIALQLDPESYEVNRAAGRLNYQLHRYEDAIRLFEKAAGLMEADLHSASMLISSYNALGDASGTRHAAELALKRAEAILMHDQHNSGVVAYSAYALAALGEAERAKARMKRAMLIDPENWNMRYAFACSLSVYLKDKEAALKMLESVYATITDAFLSYANADPDFTLLHDDPRYQAMVASAEARLAATKSPSSKLNQRTDHHG
ncbi:MAG: TIR domain-containing protein [Gammaproteobacteria bacterium]|nr:TIR domain-containing protein [Gammaproteobacteria bacterium]MBU6508962.1 TIR domain-containing protein [Gammaproteobacteria bacterium]MDE1983615.1 TIR domain-containing protein [Gammaproteobacteria bacterium]MDE2107826.1 TIR domain-containing protein [Gammaproteobacteria bacterium]MDE2459802.1 TIR domain-containing protein [Gammaproteobacteria bacterium]